MFDVPLTSAGRTCLHFHCASWVCHPKTRVRIRLLGPCYKTGQLKPFRQHPKRVCDVPPELRQPPHHALQVVRSTTSTQPKLAQPCGTLQPASVSSAVVQPVLTSAEADYLPDRFHPHRFSEENCWKPMLTCNGNEYTHE